jgi:hypothetical protein
MTRDRWGLECSGGRSPAYAAAGPQGSPWRVTGGGGTYPRGGFGRQPGSAGRLLDASRRGWNIFGLEIPTAIGVARCRTKVQAPG